MPRPNKDITKAKDFKGAIKRLLKELSGFKKLVIISLVLAALGAILSISGSISNLSFSITG